MTTKKIDTFSQAFGACVKQLRKEQGLTQEGLAQLMDCSRETISRIERGCEQPRPRLAKRLAHLLVPQQTHTFMRAALHNGTQVYSAQHNPLYFDPMSAAGSEPQNDQNAWLMYIPATALTDPTTLFDALRSAIRQNYE